MRVNIGTPPSYKFETNSESYEAAACYIRTVKVFEAIGTLIITSIVLVIMWWLVGDTTFSDDSLGDIE